jgi:hypothetical protein
MRAMRVGVGLALVAMATSVAVADEGTLLRYKWTAGAQDAENVAVDMTGKITVTTPQGTQSSNLKNHVTMPTFVRVEEVTADGLAHLKISFGLIAFDTVQPDGTPIHGEFNPADSTLVVTVNGQREVQQIPPGTFDLLAKGFTQVMDDRGQIKQFGGDDVIKQMFGGSDPTNTAMNIGQLISGMEPILPEKAVKPGDTWESPVPLEKLLHIKVPGKPVVLKYKYVGDEDLAGVPCRHLSATVEATDLSLSVPPVIAGGLRTDVTGYGLSSAIDYYLSVEDTHVVVVKSKAVEHGIIHVQGKQKDPNGEDVDMDQTVTLEDFKVASESKRM